ncbi:hypothetical protein GCM10027440_56190 [Nocardiopsis coralliicola]
MSETGTPFDDVFPRGFGALQIPHCAGPEAAVRPAGPRPGRCPQERSRPRGAPGALTEAVQRPTPATLLLL